MNGNLEHTGIISQIDGNHVFVTVVAESACATCKAKSVCGMEDGGNRLIPVYTDHPQIFEKGETVMVSVTQAMGVKAVTWAYIVPFLLMLVVLLALLDRGAGEVVAGLSSLGSLVVYYIFLYVFRKKIEKEIIFKIKKI